MQTRVVRSVQQGSISYFPDPIAMSLLPPKTIGKGAQTAHGKLMAYPLLYM